MLQTAGGGGDEGSFSLRHYDAMRTKIDMWFIPNEMINLI